MTPCLICGREAIADRAVEYELGATVWATACRRHRRAVDRELERRVLIRQHAPTRVCRGGVWFSETARVDNSIDRALALMLGGNVSVGASDRRWPSDTAPTGGG